MAKTGKSPVVDAELEELLDDLDEFLDRYEDVNDGDNGQPVPNRAMQLRQRLTAWRRALMANNLCQHCWKNPAQTTFKDVPVCKACRIWLLHLASMARSEKKS